MRWGLLFIANCANADYPNILWHMFRRSLRWIKDFRRIRCATACPEDYCWRQVLDGICAATLRDMNFCIDYVDISAAVHSKAGIGRYAESLAEALIQAQPERFGLFYNQGGNGRFPSILPANTPRHSVNLGYKPWRMAVLLGQMGHIPFNRLVPDAELFHSTEHLLMPLRGVPTVLTVHDLIYKLFPAYHKKLNYWYLNLAMPLFCRRADAIIAVSQASKRDIVTYYGVDPAKIHVVYEAAAPHFQPPPPAKIDQVRQTYDLPDQFLIHLSTIEPRKNLSPPARCPLGAAARLFPTLQLVLAGGKGWLYDDFFAKIEADGPARCGPSVRLGAR